MIEYPKMIYRPRTEPNSDLGGQKLDTLIVNSLSEEKAAARQGWVEFSAAVARVQNTDRRNERIQGVRRSYERWEWALKALAVLLALAAGAIALVKAL